MATLVINISRVAQQVGIITKAGTKTSVRIMNRGRVELAEGSKVDPNWMALNVGAVRYVETDTVPTTPAKTVTATTQAAQVSVETTTQEPATEASDGSKQ